MTYIRDIIWFSPFLFQAGQVASCYKEPERWRTSCGVYKEIARIPYLNICYKNMQPFTDRYLEIDSECTNKLKVDK